MAVKQLSIDMVNMVSQSISEVYVLVLFLPVFIVWFCVWQFARSSSKPVKLCQVPYHLDPRSGLASQCSLHFWLATIFVYFVLSGLICWQGYGLLVSLEGLENFIRISKFPLAMLSLTIPIGAFIAKLHSTQQTAMQIEVADKKNKLDAYYAQRKGVADLINSIGEIILAPGITRKIQVSQAIHFSLYKSSSPSKGAEEIDAEGVNDLLLRLGVALSDFMRLAPPPGRRRCNECPDEIYFYRMVLNLKFVCSELKVGEYIKSWDKIRCSIICFSYRAGPGGDGVIDETEVEVVGGDCSGFFSIIRYCYAILFYILSSEYSKSDLDSKFPRLDSLGVELEFALMRSFPQIIDDIYYLACKKNIVLTYEGGLNRAYKEEEIYRYFDEDPSEWARVSFL